MTKQGTIKFYEGVDWNKLEKSTTPEIKRYVKKVHEYLLSHIKGNVLVLEVGCGTGSFIKEIANQVEKVIGIDISDNLIKTAKNNLKGIDNLFLISADIDSTKIPKNYFDYIISMGTLPNIDDPIGFIRKMKKSLKPDGTIFIDTYSEKATKERIKQYETYGLTVTKTTRREIVIKEGLTEKIYTKKDLETLFKLAGIKVEVIRIHKFGYLCKAKKRK